MQVIHREPVKGGVLLFIKRFYQQEGSDLQVEYVRKTWLGWKWVWGGGFGIGGSKSPLSAKSALNYMSMPKEKNISTPFPMVFGDVLDPSVKNVTVVVRGADPGKYFAKLAGEDTGHKIWFAFLPSAAAAPYDIEGFNEKGDLIAFKTIEDSRDSGSIDLAADSVATTKTAVKPLTAMQALTAENIESLQVVGGIPGTKSSPVFQNNERAGKTVITKIVGWIHAAKPAGGQTEYGKHGYPMVISIKLDNGKFMSIEPAYDCVSTANADGSGFKTCTPIYGEIIFSNALNKIRAESPELYEWLKEGWKQEK